MLLGWMSTRVLGQYDLLVIEDENPDDQDIVYYVGPERPRASRSASPSRPASSGCGWPCTRSPTGRSSPACRGCASTSSALVEPASTSVDPDPKRFLDALRPRGRRAPRAAATRSTTAGSWPLLATPEQRAVLDQVGGLMSLLEGHGDVTMDRAGARPHPERRALRPGAAPAAPDTAVPASKLLQRLIGLEAKINQYEQGERFIAGGRGRRRPRAARPGVRGTREPCRISPRSATRTRGSAGSRAEARRQGLTDDGHRSSSSTTSPTSGCSTKLNLERDGHTRRDRGRTATKRSTRCEDAPPDLIVLDVMMPEVDGWAVLEQLKSALDKPITEIPVIIAHRARRTDGPREGRHRGRGAVPDEADGPRRAALAP